MTAADLVATRKRLDVQTTAITVSVLLAAVVTGALVSRPGTAQMAAAAGAAVLLGCAAWLRPRLSLVVLAGWLVALGLVRRLASAVVGAVAFDPLLLVGPLVLVVLVLAAHARGAFAYRGRLANCVLALGGLGVLGALNPLQGGLQVGLAGLFFFLVPQLGFWAGRALLDDRNLQRLLWVLVALAAATACYATWQVFVGFPSWDAAWIRQGGYAALNVRGTIRPFSTLTNGAEYSALLVTALVVVAALAPRRAAVPATVLGLGLFAATVLVGSRGPVVIAVVVTGLVLARRLAVPTVAAVPAGVLLLALGLFAVGTVDADRLGDRPQDRLLRHQVGGLGDPLDPAESTLGVHLGIMGDGFADLRSRPLGSGMAATNRASGALGGAQSRSTEVDVSNVAVGLGFPGLVVYVAVYVLGLGAAYRRQRGGERLALAGAAILLAQAGAWTEGGQYAVAWLPWLLLGWLDRTPPRVT